MMHTAHAPITPPSPEHTLYRVGNVVHYHGKTGTITATRWSAPPNTGSTQALVQWHYPAFGALWIDEYDLLTEAL